MKSEMKITGHLIQAYTICPRQAWLSSRNICPDQDNVYLALGRLIDSQSYSRERKEIRIEHLCLDLIRKGGQNFIIGEVKKSSRAKEAARLQLLFYLYELSQMGIKATGEVLFPEERRKEKIELNPERIQQIIELKREMLKLLKVASPPEPVRIKQCARCAYAEFCWS
jgi:CRISPR-associated exonuclease Cas4